MFTLTRAGILRSRCSLSVASLALACCTWLCSYLTVSASMVEIIPRCFTGFVCTIPITLVLCGAVRSDADPNLANWSFLSVMHTGTLSLVGALFSNDHAVV